MAGKRVGGLARWRVWSHRSIWVTRGPLGVFERYYVLIRGRFAPAWLKAPSCLSFLPFPAWLRRVGRLGSRQGDVIHKIILAPLTRTLDQTSSAMTRPQVDEVDSVIESRNVCSFSSAPGAAPPHVGPTLPVSIQRKSRSGYGLHKQEKKNAWTGTWNGDVKVGPKSSLPISPTQAVPVIPCCRCRSAMKKPRGPAQHQVSRNHGSRQAQVVE